MITKKPSDNMKKMYAAKRNLTLSKIQEAIDDIHEDNRIVTKKELMEITGLSSGTLSQDYVKKLLRENKVCQFREKRVVNNEKKAQLEKDIIQNLRRENEKLISKIQDFEIAIDQYDQKILRQRDEYEKLEHNHLLLKGKYQQVLEYLDALGVNLDSLPLV